MSYPKNSLSDVISRCVSFHGNKYDYSLVNKDNFLNMSTKVPIICNKHGVFFQDFHTHLKGEGCPFCFYENKRRALIHGVARNDLDPRISKIDPMVRKAHRIWHAMISRCYNENDKRHLSYKDCSVSKEWLLFSNFFAWFKQNYRNGWHLDKDIIGKDKRNYSKETCCFVPQEINAFFTNRRVHKSNIPRGVSKRGNGYCASCYFNGKENYLGLYRTQKEAELVYIEFKKKKSKELAEKWKNEIDERVYNAILNYY